MSDFENFELPTNCMSGNRAYRGAERFLANSRNGVRISNEDATSDAAVHRELALAQSNLAVAYELRTANLIALATHQTSKGVYGTRYWDEIAERLGVGV